MTLVLLAMMQINEQCGRSSKPSVNKTMTEPIKTPAKFNRLPEDITLETEVLGEAVKNDAGEITSYEVISVEKKLTALKASYQNSVLVDGQKKEIRFFKPICRGVSQGFEEERRERERSENELAELQKKYTVITLYCDQRKLM